MHNKETNEWKSKKKKKKKKKTKQEKDQIDMFPYRNSEMIPMTLIL